MGVITNQVDPQIIANFVAIYYDNPDNPVSKGSQITSFGKIELSNFTPSNIIYYKKILSWQSQILKVDFSLFPIIESNLLVLDGVKEYNYINFSNHNNI